MKFRIPCILLLIGVLLLAACTPSSVTGAAQKVTIYKSPQCGCCVGYAAELEKQGYIVETVTTSDMDAVKKKHNIPRNMESCHTMIIGDYFVEGHMPFEAIDKLMAEKPAIDGIALPAMPSGSPGMPGQKREPFSIFSLVDGEVDNYMTI